MTIVEATRAVTGGIDTHGEVHVAAVLDEVGGLLGTQSFRADPEGYSDLLAWLEAFGDVGKVGVEGTGSYEAGIARFLAKAGVHVVESTARTARPDTTAASPTRSTRSKPPGPFSRAGLMARPRAGTARSRPSGSSSWRSARLEGPASRRSPRCAS